MFDTFLDENIISTAGINSSTNNLNTVTSQLPANMSYAKALLDDMHDPLGLNDSLYQMQVQRVITDPKYARFEESNASGYVNEAATTTSQSAPSLLLSSSNFDARLYLRLVHQYTSYNELSQAQAHLHQALELRRETLKSLVKQNFDRFVNAKNSIDFVYADMRGKGMNSGDYGMRLTTVAVNGALEKAQQIYHPLLKRRSQEELIRKRLAVFSEYKLIFNLSAVLHKHAQLGEYQHCVYAYRKGRALLQAEAPGSTLKPILEKVWALHVEKAANALKRQLFEKVGSSALPYEVQVKLVEYLQDLDASPDPIAFFINAKLNALIHHCQVFQDQTVSALAANAAIAATSQPEDQLVILFRSVLRCLNSFKPEMMESMALPSIRAWKIIRAGFHALASQLRGILLALARFTTSIAFSADGDLQELCMRKLQEGLKSFADAFEQSVDSVVNYADINGAKTDNSGVVAFFALHIIVSMNETFAHVLEASPHPLLQQNTHDLCKYLANSLLNRIWTLAVHDSRHMGSMETWQVVSSTGFDQDFGTALVHSFEKLLLYLQSVTCTIRLRQIKLLESEQAYTFQADLWITKAFVDFVIEGLYKYVKSSTAEGSTQALDDAHVADGIDLDLIDELTAEVDLLKLNQPARLLVTLSNVLYLKDAGLIHLASSTSPENSLISVNSDGYKQIQTALGNVERAVTKLFLQSQPIKIARLFESEWLRGHLGIEEKEQDKKDKVDDSERFDLSSVMYRALMALLDVQALICDVSVKMVRSLLQPIIDEMLQAISKSVQDHEQSLKNRGVLQAIVDLDFLQQKLPALMAVEGMALLTATQQSLYEECDRRRQSKRIQNILSQFYADHGQPYSNLFLAFQLP